MVGCLSQTFDINSTDLYHLVFQLSKVNSIDVQSIIMNTIRNKLYHLVFLFASLILLQSCGVVYYQGTNVSLEQATKQDSKVKVKTITNEIYEFRRIVFEDGKFYGVQKKGSEMVNIPLEVNELSKVRLQDKTMSTVLSIVIPVVMIGVLIGLIGSSVSVGGGGFGTN